MLQLSGNYRSARLTPQGRIYPAFVFNTGMRQDISRNRLSLTITASDLFNSWKQKAAFKISSLEQTSVARRDGLIIYLGVSYRFGITKKPKDEKLQFESNQ